MTCEPWLSQGQKAEHGHLLTDTSERPGLLVDCLVTTAGIFRDRQSEFQALGRAWDAAVDYVDAHPDEANEIIARSLGGWLEDPAVVADDPERELATTARSNRQYFGTPDQPGQIYETMQYGIDVWSELGELRCELAPPM